MKWPLESIVSAGNLPLCSEQSIIFTQPELDSWLVLTPCVWNVNGWPPVVLRRWWLIITCRSLPAFTNGFDVHRSTGVISMLKSSCTVELQLNQSVAAVLVQQESLTVLCTEVKTLVWTPSSIYVPSTVALSLLDEWKNGTPWMSFDFCDTCSTGYYWKQNSGGHLWSYCWRSSHAGTASIQLWNAECSLKVL